MSSCSEIDDIVDSLLKEGSRSCLLNNACSCCIQNKKSMFLTPWCTCNSQRAKKNPSVLTSKAEKKSATRRHHKHQVFPQKDCKSCRKLTKTCTFECKNRIPFVHGHNDISGYMKEYNLKYSTTTDVMYINVLEDKHRKDVTEEEEKDNEMEDLLQLTEEIWFAIDNINQKKLQVKKIKLGRPYSTFPQHLTNPESTIPKNRRKSMVNLPKISAPLPAEFSQQTLTLKGTKITLRKSFSAGTISNMDVT